MKQQINNYEGLVMIYSNNVEKLKPLMERLESDNIDVYVEGCSRCVSNLDRCILDTINQYSPNFILIDNGENNNGLTLYEIIEDEGTIDSIPTVIIGITDELLRLKALELGAMDIIEDPLSEETYKKIKNYIRIGKRIDNGNTYDRLTGVYTRKYAEKLLKKNIEIAKEEKTSLILMLLDVDDMSGINKRIGKKKGDEVLVFISNFVKSEIDKRDFSYRYSGEKFVVAFEGKTIEHVLQVGKRLQKNVSSLTETYGVEISFSAGISALNTETYDYDYLINDAMISQALAKRDGKSKIYIHDNIDTTKKQKHILIIDSDQILAEILSSRYKNKGYRVSRAVDMEESIPLFESETIDLLIIDFSPFTALQKYLKDNIITLKGTKVIVFSSFRSESALESSFKNGADEFIQKPFSILELDLRLQKLI
ncbi:MAG: diguanylate cyclase [Clostridiaceae bacterium]|nr:diguanylate cyclase [Clostridiaceae bacterium]